MDAGLVSPSGAVVMIDMRDGGGMNALGKDEWVTVAAPPSYVLSTLVVRA